MEYVEEMNGWVRTLDENDESHSYDDEPAVIAPTNTKFWYKHGNRHRLTGPAVVYGGGSSNQEWYIDGEQYSEEDFKIHPLVRAYKIKIHLNKH